MTSAKTIIGAVSLVAVLIVVVSGCGSEPNKSPEVKVRAQATQDQNEAAFSNRSQREHLDKAAFHLSKIILPKSKLSNDDLTNLSEGKKNLDAVWEPTLKAEKEKLLPKLKRVEQAFAADMDKVEAKARADYAVELENRYLDKGMDMHVNVSGKSKDIITMKYVLFSRPLVHQMNQDGSLMASLKARGFKRLVLADGYNYTWTFDLTK